MNWPALAHFALHSDDFALIYYSSRFGKPSVQQWFTTGFDPYFLNFPEHPLHFTNFLRPVVNASIYFDSLIAPTPNSGWLMLGNILSIAVSCGLVAVLSRHARRDSEPNNLLPYAAAAFLLCSFSNQTALEYISYRGDPLAAMWALVAFVIVLESRSTLFAVVALCLALLAKETVVGAPLICAALAYWRRYSIKEVVAIAVVPVVLFAGLKLATSGFGGAAQVDAWSIRELPWHVAFTYRFFPFIQFSEIYNLRGHAWDADGVRDTIAVVLNVAFYLLLVRAFLKRDVRMLLLAAAVLIAGAVPLVLYPEPRYRFFEQACAAVLLVAVVSTISSERARVTACAVIVAFSLGFGAVHARQRAHELRAVYARSERLQDALDAALRVPGTRRVYLANDQSGLFGARAMLQLHTLRMQRADVPVAIVSQVWADGPNPHVTWQYANGRFTARADGAHFVFLGANGLIAGFWDGVLRDVISGDSLEAEIPDAARPDYALVVDDSTRALAYVSSWKQWLTFAK